MKKVLLTIVILLSIGCSKDTTIDDAYDKYEAISNTIVDEDTFVLASQYFDHEFTINKIDETTYRYYLTILNPKVGMYDIVCAIKDVDDFDSEDIMMPSKGIFDNKVHLVPYQSNSEYNYAEGIILSGIKEVIVGSPVDFQFKFYIEWANERRTISTLELIEVFYLEDYRS